MENNRLTCCQCGADLGDASDPYRDPNCTECLRAELMQELDPEPEPESGPGSDDESWRLTAFEPE